MAETIKLISDYGVTIIIVCLFIYTWWDDRKNRNEILTNSLKLENNNNEILKEMKATNENTSKTLDLLQISMNSQTEFLKKHDQSLEVVARDVRNIGSKVCQEKE